MSKARDEQYRARRERERAHAHAEDVRKVYEWYEKPVHECPQCVVDEISRKDSKGHFVGYTYTDVYHIGGSMFLLGSAEEFRTWQAGLDDRYGKRLHQKYYH